MGAALRELMIHMEIEGQYRRKYKIYLSSMLYLLHSYLCSGWTYCQMYEERAREDSWAV